MGNFLPYPPSFVHRTVDNYPVDVTDVARFPQPL